MAMRQTIVAMAKVEKFEWYTMAMTSLNARNRVAWQKQWTVSISRIAVTKCNQQRGSNLACCGSSWVVQQKIKWRRHVPAQKQHTYLALSVDHPDDNYHYPFTNWKIVFLSGSALPRVSTAVK